MIKPPILFVIVAVLVFAFVSYNIYLIWFNPKKWLKSARERIYKLPSWYPFRTFFIKAYNNDSGLMGFSKVMSIFVEIFFIVWLALILFAWFLGK